jgi:hypothetical protein
MLKEILLEVKSKIEGLSYEIKDDVVELHFENADFYDDDGNEIKGDITIKLTPDMVEKFANVRSGFSEKVKDLSGNIVEFSVIRGGFERINIETKDNKEMVFIDKTKKLKSFFKKLLKELTKGKSKKEPEGIKFVITDFYAKKYPKSARIGGKELKSVKFDDIAFKFREIVKKATGKELGSSDIVSEKTTIKEGSVIYIKKITKNDAKKLDGVEGSGQAVRKSDIIRFSFTLKLAE